MPGTQEQQAQGCVKMCLRLFRSKLRTVFFYKKEIKMTAAATAVALVHG